MKNDGMKNDTVATFIGQWEAERPDLAEALRPVEVLARIQRMTRIIDKQLKTFMAGHGLEVGEFDVLASLRRSGPPYALTAGALIPAAMVTSGAITNRIDRLEAKGLVERVRDDVDRRSVRIRLTAAGLETSGKVMEEHLRHYAELLAPLDRESADRLADALHVLLLAHGDTFGAAGAADATGAPTAS
ncbi:MarR family transcriptional regulator [Streptomyces sp. NBC_00249]|uniref:MarR family winged helix-turn-helix transcriptional regulator n=1 Tax=Streptomyces sp. NBC_00249 TaxID=2975690 RepID=UPI002251F08F|nr:MarR family transcriptional regulator [Streptomyces sp. NBC_00249]MCX5194862.1 MarR family transcriptional regulator [Streptomyces sp. NBC_00249]